MRPEPGKAEDPGPTTPTPGKHCPRYVVKLKTLKKSMVNALPSPSQQLAEFLAGVVGSPVDKHR